MAMHEQNKNNFEKIRLFYDSVYYDEIKPKTNVSLHIRRLASRVRICKNQHILDVGCGAGEWLLACNNLGAIPYGVDLSHKAIAMCKSIMPNGEFYSKPAETLPFEDKKFDIVSCFGSLEHFVNPQLALKEMVRVGKDEAKFLLLVPNADFLTYRLCLYSGTNQVDAREEIRTLQGWKKLFESSGLEVKEKWRDLHILSWSWISSRNWYLIPLRAAQALALTVWPLKWQYQVYHLCQKRSPLLDL